MIWALWKSGNFSAKTPWKSGNSKNNGQNFIADRYFCDSIEGNFSRLVQAKLPFDRNVMIFTLIFD